MTRPITSRHVIRLAITVFTFLFFYAFAVNADAHTGEGLEEWRVGWVERVDGEGGLSSDLLTEWADMRDRHGCDWPGTECVFLAPQAGVINDGTYRGIGGDVERWRGLVETYFQPGDVPWAMRVMACESGGNPYAKNPNSSASGVFQFIRSTWDWVAPQLGYGTHASGAVFDPVANIHAASWLFYNGGSQHWVCR